MCQSNPVLVEIRFTVTTFADAYGGLEVGVAVHVPCSTRHFLDRIGRTHWYRAAHHKSITIPTAAASAYRSVT
jgi:hypothetical protein